MKLFLHRAFQLLPYMLFLVAGYIVHREVTVHPMKEVFRSLTDVPITTILIASGLTILNYLNLSGYDWLGIRYAGHKIPMKRIALTSFISYAISNNTGHAMVSGTSVRYRFYSASGIPGWDILKIAVFSSLTFLVAAFTLEAGLSLLLPGIMEQGQSEPKLVHAITLLSAAALGVYWTGILFLRGPLKFKNYEFRMPSPGLALLQTVIGVADLVLASMILYVFLDPDADMPFVAFLAIFTLSLLAGILSQVPGGLGIFEATFISLAGAEYSSGDILSALVMYRIIYYFLPLVIAGALMLVFEFRHHRERIAKGGLLVSTALAQSMPVIFSLMLFFAGAMLLVSGALPAYKAHIELLRLYVPLLGVEMAHLLASLCAILLLFVARAVRLHMRAGWNAAVVILIVGALSAIVRGIDWQEASILTVILLMLLPLRRHFDRQGDMLRMSLPHGWAAMIAIVLVSSTWAGFFSYRHVTYDYTLWLHFSWMGEAARFLRASAVSVVVMGGYLTYRLMTHKRLGKIELPTADELDRARGLVRAGDTTDGFLSLLGDKYLLWSETGDAFIMYAVSPSFWIALGDPVGNAASFEALAWKFREMADDNGAQAVFYQISERFLPLYLDLGLVMVKIGESARVHLPDFTLAGGKRENQRKNRNRFLKQGFTFRILDPEELEHALPELRVISDAWLATKEVREKSFSVGYFDPDYLRRTRVAVVEKDHRIQAFANFWDLDNRRGIGVDLMRYDPASPPNLMEFLFVELMLWGQLEKYEWFSLGMAPLSGLEKHPLAPLWHKIGNIIFTHGEDFYNFEGLYAYKAKFEPEWQPRYLATPSGLRIPLVLMNVASTISGGIQGMFKK